MAERQQGRYKRSYQRQGYRSEGARGRQQHAPATPETVRRQREGQGSQLPDARQLLTQLNGYLQHLTEELSHGKSERLQEYLAFAARFHHYSRGNQWLIHAQMPTATRVASYRKWQEWGYQVAKGERGIRILAPSTRRIRPSADSTPQLGTDSEEEASGPVVQGVGEGKPAAQEGDGKRQKTIVRFVVVSVFDVSQLTPEKRPPEFFTPLAEDADAFYSRLVEAATADGFTIEQAIYTGGAEGFNRGRRIVTRLGLASMNRAQTTLHEYAHGLLHWGLHPLSEQLSAHRNLAELSVPVKECHAEATAYVVAKHFGLPTPFSADYLLQWGTTPEHLRGELDVVLAAASHMITRIEGGQGSPDPFDPFDPLDPLDPLTQS